MTDAPAAMSPLNSPYFRQPASVRSVMLKVMAALLPGVVAYVWFLGPAILVQIAIATVTALAGEACMLAIRRKPLAPFLGDASAPVTAWLIALTLPPLVPWWLTVVGTLFAIVVVKHLYGGLGQNPFNPAMAAFCVMIVAFPQVMSQWPGVGSGGGFAAQLDLILGGGREHVDAVTMATPLDALRTGLHNAATHPTVASVLGGQPIFGALGGKGWEWIAAAYLLGGLWLIWQRIITWHIPAAFIATLVLSAGLANLLDPARFAGPLFHLMSAGAMLGAFYIATDPVSGATTPRGKLIYGAGIAFLTWIIRVFGAYPDGVAFATLLMNICAPLIDLYTQPPVFGHKGEGEAK
jgi:electron transport complex protein RnfD